MRRVDPRMIKARTRLIMTQPFWGTLALHLQIVEDDRVKTMATDGFLLIYSPKFLSKLTEPETEAVIAHEVSHCAYRHMTRRGNRDPEVWNQAADFAINRDIRAAGFKLPDPHLFDTKWGKMGAEAIYDKLIAEQQAKPQPQGGGQSQGDQGDDDDESDDGDGDQGASGDERVDQIVKAAQRIGDETNTGVVVDAAPETSPGELAEIDAEWETRIRQAVNVAAKQAGKMPGHMQSLIDDLAKSTIDWRDIMQRFIDQSMSRDYTWSRPNKKMLAVGITAPRLVSDGVNHIGFMIDTSGSIYSQQALARAGGELQAAMDLGKIDKITVVYCDTRVTNVETFTAGETIKLDAKGGGGTYFKPAFDWFERNEPDVAALIYFTDLMTADWDQLSEPAQPVMWLVYDRGQGPFDEVPWGEAIPCED